MIRIDKDGEYKASRVRSGTAAKGDWELVVVKAEGRARQEVTVFAENVPSGVVEDGKFRVKEIRSLSLRQKKDYDGNWTRQDVSISAVIEPADTEQAVDLEDLGGFDDLDLGTTTLDDGFPVSDFGI